MSSFLRTSAWVVSLVAYQLFTVIIQAQPAPVSSKININIKECYRVIKNDSVEMYYDAHYKLSPVACAQIRRHCRINGNGNFEGRFKDTQVATGQVLMRGRYVDNQRDGVFEEYVPETGKLRWRGTFAQGKPQGEWQYWYANGQPQQVLRYEGNAVRFWQYWNEQGQQRLTDGNGEWRTTTNGGWQGGAVQNGLPNGRWESHGGEGFADKQPLLAFETFEKGQFRRGQVMFTLPGATPVYRDESRLLPMRPGGAYQTAEALQLGVSCEQQAKDQQLAAGGKMHMPEWLGGNYVAMESALAQKLKARWPYWPATGNLIELRATIDEQGKLTNVKTEPQEAKEVTEWLVSLGKWKPAQRNGQAVPGSVYVKMVRDSEQRFLVQVRAGVSPAK